MDLETLRGIGDGARRYPPGVSQAAMEHCRPQALRPTGTLLGVFLPNVSYGFTMSLADTETVPTYEYNKAVAQTADKHGLDFVFPVARWKGNGGPSDYWGVCLENFTLAAALTQVTERITVLSTVHTSLVHPVQAAKLGASVDQMSDGRWGLNLVAGWHLAENDMFDVDRHDHEKRYAIATEWLQIVKQLWSDGELDHDGEHFKIKAASCWPRPRQVPRPPIVNAGASPRGRDFAVRECDMNFIVAGSRESAVQQVADAKKHAAGLGKEARVCLVVYGLIGEDPADLAAMKRDIVDNADWIAVSNIVSAVSGSYLEVTGGAGKKQELEDYYSQMVFGTGCYPIIGTAEEFAHELKWLFEEAGADGIILSFFNWHSMLEYFCEKGLPVLVEAGIWSPHDVAG